MSLEAIETVARAENESKARKAAAEQEAKERIAQAEKDGPALLEGKRRNALKNGAQRFGRMPQRNARP